MVLYYFGAMLMISACAWFLGDKWDVLGTPGVFITTLIYFLIALTVGRWLLRNDYPVAGALQISTQ